MLCCITYLLYLTGFTILIKYYNLLYQSIIPNSNLIISILKQHLSIPPQTETFLLSGENRRIKSQKILNWLLVTLDSNRDYKQFCSLIGTVSVLTDLPHRLIRGNLYCINAIYTIHTYIWAKYW